MNDMLTRLNNLKDQIGTEQKSIRTLQQTGSGDYAAVVDSATALLKKVSDLEFEVYNADQGKGEATVYLTDFQQDFQSAYQSLSEGYDEAPRPSDLAMWQQDRTQLEGYLNRYNDLVRTDVVAFNKIAAAKGAITLAAGAPVTLPAARDSVVAAAASRSATHHKP